MKGFFSVVKRDRGDGEGEGDFAVPEDGVGEKVIRSSAAEVEKDLGIEGLCLENEFLTEEEEAKLMHVLNNTAWDKTEIKRRTMHFGKRYSYKNKNLNGEEVPPIPEWAEFIVDRLMERQLLNERPDQLIVNEYLPGQGIGSHVDSPASFEDGVVSISLNSTYLMEFDLEDKDNRKPKIELKLPRRSALCLHGEARYKWRHGIAARKNDHGVARGRRISLTFRKVKQ